jgi:hypothetical protein
MFDEFLGRRVVLDLRSPFVCIGTLKRIESDFLELRGADLHDLRDSDTTRENYLAAARTAGIHSNRKRVVIARSEIVAVSALEDVVNE